MDIARLYAGLNEKGDLSSLLESVCRKLGGSTAFVEIGLNDGRNTLLYQCPHWPGAENAGLGECSRQLSGGDLRRLVALKPGKVLYGQEMAEFFRITGGSQRVQKTALRNRVILGVTARHDMSAEIVLVRARDATRTFDQRDSRQLKAILQHLAKVRELGLSFGAYRQERRALSAILDHISSGCLLVNERCYLRFMNAAARRSITQSKVLRVSFGRLTGHTHGSSKLLWRRVLDFANAPSRKSDILALGDSHDGAPTVLRLVHVDPVANGPEHRVAIIFPSGRPVQDDLLSEIGSIYGLTPAEIRMLDAIAREETLSDARKYLGVSASTAHTHLQHLYNKLDVHSHASLMRFLSSCGVI